MAAMPFTQPQLRFLRIAAALSAIAMAVTLFVAWRYARNGPVPVERWQIGVGALPWLVFFASFLALTHHSWFRREEKAFVLWARRLFFWGLVACLATIFAGLYAGLVFPR